MTWFEKIINFIQDNWDLLSKNPFPFILLVIICIGLSLGLNKLINSDKDKKIKKLTEKNNELQEKLKELKDQNSVLKQKFSESDIVQLISGIDNNTQSSFAENVSKHIAEKYLNDKN